MINLKRWGYRYRGQSKNTQVTCKGVWYLAKKESDRKQLIEDEKVRLQELFNEIPSKKILLAIRLIEKAAFMHVTLEELQDYINKHGEITRKDAEGLICKEKTTTANILNKMIEEDLIEKVGNGPSTKYIIK